MAWQCPCGVSNRNSKDACRACGTPKDMVWSPQGFATPAEARLFSRATEYTAPSADHAGRLVKIVWMAAIVLGASAGIYLARIRSSNGLWAAKAVLNSWKNLPWTFWGNVTTWLGDGTGIVLGIILPLLCFLLPGRVRQNVLTFFGQLLFALLVASLVGTTTYFVGIFIYDLGPYFR